MWDLNTKEVYRVSLHIWDEMPYVQVGASVWLGVCHSDCRNSRATPQLWRPCALPPHGLLTATASIFCPGRHTIDCSAFGEYPGGRHDVRSHLVLGHACSLVWCSRTSFFSLHRQVREDGKDKNSVVSFALTDEPRHIDLIASKSREEVRVYPVLYLAISKFVWFRIE